MHIQAKAKIFFLSLMFLLQKKLLSLKISFTHTFLFSKRERERDRDGWQSGPDKMLAHSLSLSSSEAKCMGLKKLKMVHRNPVQTIECVSWDFGKKRDPFKVRLDT